MVFFADFFGHVDDVDGGFVGFGFFLFVGVAWRLEKKRKILKKIVKKKEKDQKSYLNSIELYNDTDNKIT